MNETLVKSLVSSRGQHYEALQGLLCKHNLDHTYVTKQVLRRDISHLPAELLTQFYMVATYGKVLNDLQGLLDTEQLKDQELEELRGKMKALTDQVLNYNAGRKTELVKLKAVISAIPTSDLSVDNEVLETITTVAMVLHHVNKDA